MRIRILREAGLEEALLGLGLSYGKTKAVFEIASKELHDELYSLLVKLHDKDGGHNKALESIAVWLDITGPRYWWQQMATYRIGTSTQSESTMHTLGKNVLYPEDFEHPVPKELLSILNNPIYLSNNYYLDRKNLLPESFLQRRIVCTNYKALRHIINQRKHHKLQEWKQFCEHVTTHAQYKELLT